MAVGTGVSSPETLRLWRHLRQVDMLRNRPSPRVRRQRLVAAVSGELPLDAYSALLHAQGGVCAICKQPPEGKRLARDHNHTTGQFRGLLCTRCNVALGLLGDDPSRAEGAARYLVFWQEEARLDTEHVGGVST